VNAKNETLVCVKGKPIYLTGEGVEHRKQVPCVSEAGFSMNTIDVDISCRMVQNFLVKKHFIQERPVFPGGLLLQQESCSSCRRQEMTAQLADSQFYG
jgi:hypothetical protein